MGDLSAEEEEGSPARRQQGRGICRKMSIWVDRSCLAWSNLHYKFSPTVRVPDCHERRETSE